MKIATFYNYSDDIFAHPSLGGHDDICQWGGEPYCFPAGSKIKMEDWKSAHFAKHFTNRELLKLPKDDKGVCIGEMHTSPKMKNLEFYSSEDDPIFMEIYNKCYLPVEMEEQTPEKLMDAMLNSPVIQDKPTVSQPFCEYCDAVGPISHKKNCTRPKKTAESEFEGK